MKTTLSPDCKKLLTSILATAGWAKTIQDIYAGGKFLSYLDTAPEEIEISDKSLECINKALKFHADAGAIPASPTFVLLLDALNIKP